MKERQLKEMSNDTSSAESQNDFELDPKTKCEVWVGLRVLSKEGKKNEMQVSPKSLFPLFIRNSSN